MPKECNMATEAFRTRYRMTAIWLQNWPRRRSKMTTERTEYSTEWHQAMISEISQRRISLPKDFTWRSRGLPGALPYQATDRDAYQMAFRRIKNYRGTAYWTECGTTLPTDYREPNGYPTEAIIRVTFTEKQFTETLPNAESRDAGIRICKAAFQEQKHVPIAVSMTTQCEAYVLDMDQWHTAHAWCNWRILPPSNGHQRVRWEPTAMTMPGAKAHIIAQSQDETPLQWHRDWEHWDASYDS